MVCGRQLRSSLSGSRRRQLFDHACMDLFAPPGRTHVEGDAGPRARLPASEEPDVPAHDRRIDPTPCFETQRAGPGEHWQRCARRHSSTLMRTTTLVHDASLLSGRLPAALAGPRIAEAAPGIVTPAGVRDRDRTEDISCSRSACAAFKRSAPLPLMVPVRKRAADRRQNSTKA